LGGQILILDKTIYPNVKSKDLTPIHTFAGEPVNWRIFPRSKHYENQLHIIYNDRLEIISFNHDYFVNQNEKWAGIEVFRRYKRNIDIEDVWTV